MRSTQSNHSRGGFKIIHLALLVTITTLLFPMAALAAPPSPLDPASVGARSLANLHYIIFIVAALVFLVVGALLSYSLVRFQRKSENEPQPDQNFPGNPKLEIIWTAAPILILMVLLALTFQTLNDIGLDNHPAGLTIRVTGKQWVWEVNYPEYNLNLMGELRVPVNQDIKIELTSQDVIHSFWVPRLGERQEAIPGYLTTTWFRAGQEGTYPGECAEYCGLAHSNMVLKVIVLDQNSFDIWLADQTRQQVSAPATTN